jgi:hypothetical protein
MTGMTHLQTLAAALRLRRPSASEIEAHLGIAFLAVKGLAKQKSSA